MAIVKNSFRVSRLDSDLYPGNRGSISGSDEYNGNEEFQTSSEADDDSGDGSGGGNADADSGMGSDEFEPSELGEPGTELCQVGNQSCSIPVELYDLSDLGGVLSPETWNECLSEEERFALAEYLPDMDQETFARTLRELFSGANFHFGSPLARLFNQLKGGLCDPRVVLYRQGMNLVQRSRHYYHLRRYQNSMVRSLLRMRSSFGDYAEYGIDDRLHRPNTRRGQRHLSHDRDGYVGAETDSESGRSGERFWDKRPGTNHRALPSSGVSRAGKDHRKGLLKVSAKKEHGRDANYYPFSGKPGVEKKNGSPLLLLGHPRKDQVAGFNIGTGRRARNQMNDEYEDYDDRGYEMGMQQHKNALRGNVMARAGLLKPGRRHEVPKRYSREMPAGFSEEENEGYPDFSRYHDRNKGVVDQEVTIASYDRNSVRPLKKAKYSQNDLMYPAKDQTLHQPLRGAQVDWPAGGHPSRHSKMQRAGSSKFKTGKSAFSSDSKVYFHSDHRSLSSQEKIRTKLLKNEGLPVDHSGDMYTQSEETESDSSDQLEGDGDNNHLPRKMGYPSALEGRRLVKSGHDSKKGNKFASVDKKMYSRLPDGGPSIHTRDFDSFSTKMKQKSKTNEPSYLHDIKLMKGHQPSAKLQPPVPMSSALERKRKGVTDLDYALQQPNYMRGYVGGALDDSYTTADGRHGPLLGCNTMLKRRKEKGDGVYVDEPDEPVHQQFNAVKHSDDMDLTKKKGKRKADADTGFSTSVAAEPIVTEKGAIDVELEMKTQKKPFTLITPSIHTGFSFSIIHLLSAVRKAMITPHTEDTLGMENHLEKDGKPKPRREQSKMFQVASGGTLPSQLHESSQLAEQDNLPSLSVQEIVNRVRSNPGDPCILETQEPLQDLVRGVLKIFSCKTAPLGAKGWKTLVIYEKSSKSWTWVGPISPSSSDIDPVEEETSSEAWSIPHKMLVKLVDAFANWLKCGQETLQQIGSLPAPPITMLPILDEKERFKDLRAQKSLNTISPSSDELRAYFRKEEVLRYSVPDRAFSYTAADGKKSIVAPLRRGGGKPTSKARDHFMLKPDRPPHVTILCLVRDAAARLPGSIGTRADVCTLIRDSQYIVEDVSDAQVNQVVSGALDRLHYERDPCVQFDGDRKLWVYLHRDREEEDFEDDGTSSTKKWKRQRKDIDPSDMGAVNDTSYHTTEDPGIGSSHAGYDLDLNPDLNSHSSVRAKEETHLIYNGLRSNMGNIQSYSDLTQAGQSQSNLMSRETLGLHSSRENKMLCQENSTNEYFDDEAFSRGRPAGLLRASLL